MNTKRDARPEWWFLCLAGLPALSTILVYGEACIASLMLGHWPIPYVDDPKQLATAPLHFVSTLVLLAVLPGAIFLTAVSIKNWRTLRTSHVYWPWIGFLVVSLAFLLWISRTETRTWSWWAD